MKREIKHYNADNIINEAADINIIYGERSNGKSYQIKHKRGVIKYLDSVLASIDLILSPIYINCIHTPLRVNVPSEVNIKSSGCLICFV